MGWYVETCCKCKTQFCFTDEFRRVALERCEEMQFYCPHGHPQHYVRGESELDKLRRERDLSRDTEGIVGHVVDRHPGTTLCRPVALPVVEVDDPAFEIDSRPRELQDVAGPAGCGQGEDDPEPHMRLDSAVDQHPGLCAGQVALPRPPGRCPLDWWCFAAQEVLQGCAEVG